jgi:hypothetical protein
MKARPTEYKGVEYRSKSEAQFALWLHWVHQGYDQNIVGVDERKHRITQDGCTGFEYEPKLPGEFQCDFMTWRTAFKNGFVFPRLLFCFIEYKPTRPTETYIRDWLKKANNCCRSISLSRDTDGIFEFRIYYGSAYSQDGGIVVLHSDGSIEEQNTNWCEKLRGHMLAYRFDLQKEFAS